MFSPFSAAQKQVKDKKTSKLADKKTKIRTKTLQSKPRATQFKTKEKKKPESAKRQKTDTDSSSSSRARKTVRVNTRGKSRNASPSASVTPAGLSNSAPPTRSTRWPASVTKKCERLLKELISHEDSWPFLKPVDKCEVRSGRFSLLPV